MGPTIPACVGTRIHETWVEKDGSGGGEDQNSVGDSVVIFSIRPLKYLTSCLLTTGKCTATQGGVGRVVRRIGWTAWIRRMAGVFFCVY